VRREPISYVEATIRALEEDNAELLAEIERLRAALEEIASLGAQKIGSVSYAMAAIARAALTAQPAAPGGDK
jgi:hypothetical protein